MTTRGILRVTTGICEIAVGVPGRLYSFTIMSRHMLSVIRVCEITANIGSTVVEDSIYRSEFPAPSAMVKHQKESSR